MHKLLATVSAIAVVGFVAVSLWLGPTIHPKLSVTHIQTIDGHGYWRLHLGVTNVGNCTVFTSKLGEIEMLNHTNWLSVGATSPLSKLAPGEGQFVDVVLSEAQMDAIDGKWPLHLPVRRRRIAVSHLPLAVGAHWTRQPDQLDYTPVVERYAFDSQGHE
ncbi:MAG TPA: hypothetical protein VEC99_17235 [Clostridia bacterium]|nr:hypothetical protein [Clostridia bacterium]